MGCTAYWRSRFVSEADGWVYIDVTGGAVQTCTAGPCGNVGFRMLVDVDGQRIEYDLGGYRDSSQPTSVPVTAGVESQIQVELYAGCSGSAVRTQSRSGDFEVGSEIGQTP